VERCCPAGWTIGLPSSSSGISVISTSGDAEAGGAPGACVFADSAGGCCRAAAASSVLCCDCELDGSGCAVAPAAGEVCSCWSRASVCCGGSLGGGVVGGGDDGDGGVAQAAISTQIPPRVARPNRVVKRFTRIAPALDRHIRKVVTNRRGVFERPVVVDTRPEPRIAQCSTGLARHARIPGRVGFDNLY
jgi:hypothetical protein